LWGRSAAIYAPQAENGYQILKQATATESFAVMGVKDNNITLDQTSVKAEGDWSDSDKQTSVELVIPVPSL
jgi:hypothetical protein